MQKTSWWKDFMPRSKYKPHQGKQECERRKKQRRSQALKELAKIDRDYI